MEKVVELKASCCELGIWQWEIDVCGSYATQIVMDGEMVLTQTPGRNWQMQNQRRGAVTCGSSDNRHTLCVAVITAFGEI